MEKTDFWNFPLNRWRRRLPNQVIQWRIREDRQDLIPQEELHGSHIALQ